MKISFLTRLAVICFVVVSIVSCDKQPQFTIEGSVSDADSTVLYLEKRTMSQTILIDSITLGEDGSFKFSQPAPIFGEFYLLKANMQGINIAIDSTETVVIKTSKASFGSEYTVSGSISTEQIKDVTLAQQKLTSTAYQLIKTLEVMDMDDKGYAVYAEKMQVAINEYKSVAESIIRSDYTSLAAYFALFQKVNDLLIFDPYNKKDRSLYQATATGWKQSRPESERAIYLENFILSILAETRRESNLNEKLLQLDASNVAGMEYYNMSLPDIYGKNIDLISLKGKVIILDFTAYQTEYSPAHNVALNKVYVKNKAKVEIYQVSLDKNEHAWKNAAANLPWICVRDAQSLNSPSMNKFNIQGLPTTFIFDRNGDLVKRVLPSDDLEAAVKNLMY